MIAQLVIALGPGAIQFIQQLVQLWNKPSLTVDEVNSLCAACGTSFDQYIAQAKAQQTPIGVAPQVVK